MLIIEGCRSFKAAVRLFYGIKKFERISCALKLNKWLSMYNRRHLHEMCLFNNSLRNKSRYTILVQQNSFQNDIYDINIRRNNTLTPPLHGRVFERSFLYYIVKSCNALKFELIEKQNIK